MTIRWLAASLAGLVSLVVSLPAVQTPPLASGAQAGTGFILGKVIEADSGTPIPSVLVTIGSGNPTSALLAGGTDRRKVLTDAQGRFLFRNLAKGSYTLNATAGGNGYSVSGFVVTGSGQLTAPYLNASYGQRRPNGPAEAVDLADGQRVADVDIRMWKGAAIDGTVFDESGEPLIGTVVVAVKRSSDGRLLTGPSTKTDDRGLYHLGSLEPGDYVIVVPQTQVLMPVAAMDEQLSNPTVALTSLFMFAGLSPPPAVSGVQAGQTVAMAPSANGVVNGLPPVRSAGRLYAYETTFYPNVSLASGATTVRLQPAQERGAVDIHLQPVPSVEVSGHLADPDGPVTNFGVHLMPSAAGDGASALEVSTTITDGRGAFVFPFVPTGRYTVLALRNVPLPQLDGPAPSGVSNQFGAWASQPVTVGEQGISGLTLTLRTGLSVAGRVEFRGASALPSDRIRRSLSLERTSPLFRTARSQSGSEFPPAGGEFKIGGILPGRYVLRVSDAGYAAWALESVTVAGRDFADRALTVGDSDISNMAIVLTDRPAELSGSVVGRTGTADGDASVFVFPVDRTTWSDARASTRTFRTVRVSKSGAFRLPRMLPGEYLVVAAPDALAGDWPDERLLAILAANATTLRIDPGEQKTVALRTVAIR